MYSSNVNLVIRGHQPAQQRHLLKSFAWVVLWILTFNPGLLLIFFIQAEVLCGVSEPYAPLQLASERIFVGHPEHTTSKILKNLLFYILKCLSLIEPSLNGNYIHNALCYLIDIWIWNIKTFAARNPFLFLLRLYLSPINGMPFKHNGLP